MRDSGVLASLFSTTVVRDYRERGDCGPQNWLIGARFLGADPNRTVTQCLDIHLCRLAAFAVTICPITRQVTSAGCVGLTKTW